MGTNSRMNRYQAVGPVKGTGIVLEPDTAAKRQLNDEADAERARRVEVYRDRLDAGRRLFEPGGYEHERPRGKPPTLCGDCRGRVTPSRLREGLCAACRRRQRNRAA